MIAKRNTSARQSETALQLTVRLNEAEKAALEKIIVRRARAMGRPASTVTTIRSLILEEARR